jgi:uncharacterized protein YciW
MESHEPDLRAEVHDPAQVRQIQDDYRAADLDPPTRHLLDWAVQLTLAPQAMSQSQIEALRASGFDDEAILDAAHLVAYFNYANRLMDALGIGPEPDMRHRRAWSIIKVSVAGVLVRPSSHACGKSGRPGWVRVEHEMR